MLQRRGNPHKKRNSLCKQPMRQALSRIRNMPNDSSAINRAANGAARCYAYIISPCLCKGSGMYAPIFQQSDQWQRQTYMIFNLPIGGHTIQAAFPQKYTPAQTLRRQSDWHALFPPQKKKRSAFFALRRFKINLLLLAQAFQ